MMIRFNVSDKSKVLPLVAAFMLVGYESCGGPLGMGFLQAVDGVNEDNILTFVPPPEQNHNLPNNFEIYGDYVAGRMMKTGICFNEVEGWVEISDRNPTPDYQGSCSGEPTDPGVLMSRKLASLGGSNAVTKYASYRDLLSAAAKRVGMTLETNDIIEV